MKLEPKDWLKLIVLAVGIAVTYGALGQRVSALEKATEPIPQLQTDLAVIKAVVLDMQDDVKAMRRGGR